MTFQIDTGTERTPTGWKVNVAEIIADTAADNAGENATPEEMAIAAVPLILAQIVNPVKPETVRRHLIKLWPLIEPMAETAPDSFDQILTEFAERASTFR